MKTMKKLASLLLALIMVMSLATSAFATKITIEDKNVEGAEYEAYKLLNATDGGEGKFAYTVNEKYRDALKTVLGANLTDDQIIAAIAEKKTAEAIRAFADAIYNQIKGLQADYTAAANVFDNVAQGYYLIVETDTGSAEGFEEDTFSLVMLDTAGKTDITVETKEKLPESKKKVKDKNDSTGTETDWQDSADYDIGDAVPFQITFTLPSDFANYKKYHVGIHDVQATGLTYNNDLKVTVNGTDITGWFTYSAVPGDNCTFHITCEDIVAKAKEKNVTLAGSNKIVFEYTSTLNENAKLGSTGNPNEMQVEFSNNPYGDGTSRTPKDKVIVFTYEVNVDKYKEAIHDDNKLIGADFALYKQVSSTTTGARLGSDIKAEFAENVKDGALADDKYYIVAGVKSGNASGFTFGFKGVDDGNYVLVETTVPAGYNAWDAVAFSISAKHDIESADPKLTELTGGNLFTGEVGSTNKDTGILNTNIVNKSGTELPSTGGMGTTMFYVIGGILFTTAVVLLVAKKRMAN